MNQNSNKKIILIALLVALLILVAAISSRYFFYQKNSSSTTQEQSKEEQSATQPTPQPAEQTKSVSQLATGLQTYKIITNKPRNPQITEVTLDPLDVKKGQTQTITVKVADSKNGAIVNENATVVTVKTDNKESKLDLKLVKVEGQPELTTTWHGSFVLDDSNDKIYSAKVDTKNIFGTDTTTITFR